MNDDLYRFILLLNKILRKIFQVFQYNNHSRYLIRYTKRVIFYNYLKTALNCLRIALHHVAGLKI
jgi:hypothetical protein